MDTEVTRSGEDWAGDDTASREREAIERILQAEDPAAKERFQEEGMMFVLHTWFLGGAKECGKEAAQVLGAQLQGEQPGKLVPAAGDVIWRARTLDSVGHFLEELVLRELREENEQAHQDKAHVRRIEATLNQVKEKRECLQASTRLCRLADELQLVDRFPNVLPNRNPSVLAWLTSALKMSQDTEITTRSLADVGKMLATSGGYVDAYCCILLYMVLEAAFAQEEDVEMILERAEEQSARFSLGSGLPENNAKAVLYCWLLEAASSRDIRRFSSLVEYAARKLAGIDLATALPAGARTAEDHAPGGDFIEAPSAFHALRVLLKPQVIQDPFGETFCLGLAEKYTSWLSTGRLQASSASEASILVRIARDNIDWSSAEHWPRQWHSLMAFIRQLQENCREEQFVTVLDHAWKSSFGRVAGALGDSQARKMLSEMILKTPFTQTEAAAVRSFLEKRSETDRSATDFLVAVHLLRNDPVAAEHADRRAARGNRSDSRLQVRSELIRKHRESSVPCDFLDTSVQGEKDGEIRNLALLLETLPSKSRYAAVQGQAKVALPIPPAVTGKSHLSAALARVSIASPTVRATVVSAPILPAQPTPSAANPFAGMATPAGLQVPSFFAGTPGRENTGASKDQQVLRGFEDKVHLPLESESRTPVHTKLHTRKRRAMPRPLVPKPGADQVAKLQEDDNVAQVGKRPAESSPGQDVAPSHTPQLKRSAVSQERAGVFSAHTAAPSPKISEDILNEMDNSPRLKRLEIRRR